MSAILMADAGDGRSQKIILGTMRLHEIDRSVKEWVGFFERVYERGVRTLHSSNEYDSFPLFTDIITELRRVSPSVRFRHIVKLANPSFDDIAFDADRLSAAVDGYKDALASDHIDDVQWMWRQGLDADPQRIEAFHNAVPALCDAVNALKAGKHIGRFLCFPYSPAFAVAALDCDAIDGVVVYRNSRETDYDAAIDAADAAGKTAIIIRPFFAGQTLTNTQPGASEQLDFALSKPAIESAILSSSRLAHIDQLIDG